MDYKMTDRDISRALKEECYLDEGHGGYAGYKDLVPLLKVLRWKALRSHGFETAVDATEEGIRHKIP